jgi:nitrogen regulatory protein PII
LGQEGIHACQLGPFSSPIYFTPEEASIRQISKEDIIEKRKWIFDLLNSKDAETPCKHCDMVVHKELSEVRFDQIGHIDLAAATTCNLRCDFCGYTHNDSFAEAKYDALEILKKFDKNDVVWKAAVDFNGGEPTILKNFDEYLEYYTNRQIRVFLFTNGLVYKQTVFESIKNGGIRWCVVSLDAGTSHTYNKTKKSTKYETVLENIVRYSQAGRFGNGAVSVKYIFTKNNSGDDDILGFVYAMIACRPQEVWLTFDFDPLCDIPADAPNFGGYDYSIHITAYVKMYELFRKHGIVPIHYAEKHLAPASLHGKELLRMVKERLLTEYKIDKDLDLNMQNYRRLNDNNNKLKNRRVYYIDGSYLKCGDDLISISENVFDIAIAPASHHVETTINELSEFFNVKFVIDKDVVYKGKKIGNLDIISYENIYSLKLDFIYVKATDEILEEVVDAIFKSNSNVRIIIDKKHKYTKFNNKLNRKVINIQLTS